MPATTASLYSRFVEHSSADRISTDLTVLDLIRQAYPGHVIKQISTKTCDVIGFAEAGYASAQLHTEGDDYVALTMYDPPKRRLDSSVGRLRESVTFGTYTYGFMEASFPVHKVEWFAPNEGSLSYVYIAVADPERSDRSASSAPSDQLIGRLFIEAGMWTSEPHSEIYVFDNGRWTKNQELYASVQNASWDDVVVDPATKADLIADIQGFFDNRALYEEYSVPWKRGIIFHGSPGNGKTISVKAIMATLAGRREPIPSLYVKSLEANQGREFATRQIFRQARSMAPCLLVFEDLDSLVTDKVRSYFLNEIDGLESNDGILMIGSTNHLDRLDPAVAKRPSRFDRKYHFKIPALQERTSYAKYWGEKLARNKDMQWESQVADVVGQMTDGFSFAYLKELFMTSLFVMASGRLQDLNIASSGQTEGELAEASKKDDDPKPADETLELPPNLANNPLLRVMVRQISILRQEMESASEDGGSVSKVPSALTPAQARRMQVMATPVSG